MSAPNQTHQIAAGLSFGARMTSVGLFGPRGVLLGASVLVAWIALSALMIFLLDRRAVRKGTP